MGKFKIESTYFEPETGISFCLISYKGNTFSGWANFNTEDAEKYPVSSFLGCRIAEKRAIKKALMTELKRQKDKLKTYDEIVLLFNTYEGIPDELAAAYNHLEKDVSYREKMIDSIDRAIKNDIDNYFNYHDNKKAKKESCE